MEDMRGKYTVTIKHNPGPTFNHVVATPSKISFSISAGADATSMINGFCVALIQASYSPASVYEALCDIADDPEFYNLQAIIKAELGSTREPAWAPPDFSSDCDTDEEQSTEALDEPGAGDEWLPANDPSENV